jgi:NTE family protein
MSSTVGFVFGGAGTRGDFQVGAARLLHDRGITPRIITGSSGGAIVALKLAEGGTAVIEAEQLLRGLGNGSAIYQRLPWVVEAANTADVANRMATWADRNAVGLAAVGLSTLPLLAAPGFLTTVSLVAGGAAIATTAPQVAQGLAADALYDATPLDRLLRANVNSARIAGSGIRLRIAVVGIETARLRFVTENGGLVSHDGAVPTAGRCAQLSADLTEARATLQRLNVQIRNYVFTDPGPDPEYQELIRNRNEVSRRVARLLRDQELSGCEVDAGIDVVRAAVASGAMPGFFPPVDLAGETYVDGGLRSLLPVRAAVQAGADEIYAVYPKPNLTRSPVSEPGRIAQYLNRAIDLMLEEIRQLESRAALPPIRLFEIQPSNEVMVHGDLVIEPGLTAISIGYGYMRASDVVDGAALTEDRRATLRTLSDLITRSRLACWSLEQYVMGMTSAAPSLIDAPDRPPTRFGAGDPDLLRFVRVRKWMIGHLVRRRSELGGAVPSDANSWAREWEPHGWDPPTDSPWERYATSADQVDSADPATFTVGGIGVREASGSEVSIIDGSRRFSPNSAFPTPRVYVVEDGCLSFVDFGGVWPGPPAGQTQPPDRCAALRAQDVDLVQQRGRLSAELNALDPHEDRLFRTEIQAQLSEIDIELAQLREHARQLGCR